MDGANANANKYKVVSPDSPLTVSMFADANATVVGDGVCLYMFNACTGIGFHLGENFGFHSEWNRVTTVGEAFCIGMFSNCSTLSSLSSNFNLPQGITTVGDSFCYDMFLDCASLASLPSNFNIPQGITTVGDYFCYSMFYGCYHDNFQVPAGFRFPLLSSTEVNKTDVFCYMFYVIVNKTYPPQPVSAATIINGNPTPSSARNTFRTISQGHAETNNRWGAGTNSLPANWR